MATYASTDRKAIVKNKLLLAMPEETFARIRPALDFVLLKSGDPIYRSGEAVEYLYFVNQGFVSLVKTTEDGRSVEVAEVGVDGLTSPMAMFGAGMSMADAVVQISGSGFRIRTSLLKREMAQDSALRRIVEDYLRYLFLQFAQTAACNRLHSVEQRCCRWLLLAHDNVQGDRFELTHEFLAAMLGVQRSGVSAAVRTLKLAGLIEYRRGAISILDRRGLEVIACECYHALQEDLEAMLAGFRQAFGLERRPRELVWRAAS